MSMFVLTIYLHWSPKGRTNHGHKSTEFTFFDNSLLKGKILSKDHNGESKQWYERPAKVKSNLKSFLVFVKHSPDLLKETSYGATTGKLILCHYSELSLKSLPVGDSLLFLSFPFFSNLEWHWQFCFSPLFLKQEEGTD